MSNLPTLADLTTDVDKAFKNDQLNLLLNQNPPQGWIQEHSEIKGYLYIPIDKIEHLLKKIFKRYRIEVTGQGAIANGVYVTVRVHYQHPIDDTWDYHDGIGATDFQTKKGASAADLAQINPGAVAMACPIAKTRAIKDACDHFGRLFGSDLNRKDLVEYKSDSKLEDKVQERIETMLDDCVNSEQVEKLQKQVSKEYGDKYSELFLTKLEELK